MYSTHCIHNAVSNLFAYQLRLKPGVHIIITTIATIAQKELSDETVRSAIAMIAEIENVHSISAIVAINGNMQTLSVAVVVELSQW